MKFLFLFISPGDTGVEKNAQKVKQISNAVLQTLEHMLPPRGNPHVDNVTLH